MTSGVTLIAALDDGASVATCGPDGAWEVSQSLDDVRVHCVATVPGRPGTLYAGTDTGIVRSEDLGVSWTPAGLEEFTVKSIASDPSDPRVIYAGLRPALVAKSEDGGQTWRDLDGFRRIPNRWWWLSPAEPPWKAYVKGLAVSPTQPQLLVAGIEFGALVKSEDGGESWSGHRSGALRDCHDLKYHATNGDWVYEAGGTGGGAAFSRDGGLSWSKAPQGLAAGYGVACAADPGDPEVWYVSVAPGPKKAYGLKCEAYLHRAVPGDGWQAIGWEQHPLASMPLTLVTDPQEPGHLYAGLRSGEVWHSADRGDDWRRLPVNLGPLGLSMQLTRS